MSSCSPITLIWFQATHIMVTEELPVSAFGQRVPVLPEQDFSLPWMWSFLNFRWIRESKSQQLSFFLSVESWTKTIRKEVKPRIESRVHFRRRKIMKEQCCQMARAGGRKIQVRRPKSYFPELFWCFSTNQRPFELPRSHVRFEISTCLVFFIS